jgi:hypothetical protein
MVSKEAECEAVERGVVPGVVHPSASFTESAWLVLAGHELDIALWIGWSKRKKLLGFHRSHRIWWTVFRPARPVLTPFLTSC